MRARWEWAGSEWEERMRCKQAENTSQVSLPGMRVGRSEQERREALYKAFTSKDCHSSTRDLEKARVSNAVP